MTTDNTIHSLADLVDSETLQGFQQAIAEITGVPTVICDRAGRPVIGPSGPVRALGVLQSEGAKTCVESWLKRLTQDPHDRPHHLLEFHAGPIAVEGRTLGAVIVGGVPTTRLNDEQARALAAELGLAADQAGRLRSALKPWSAASRASAERMIGVMTDILCKLAGQAQRVQRLGTELDAVHDIAGRLRGTQDIDDMLEDIAREVCDLMGVKASSIRLLEEGAGELVIKAAHNLSPAYLAKGAVLVAENPIDKAALGGEVVYVEDAASDPRIRFPKSALDEGIVSGLSVGMTCRGDTIGVMRIYTDRPHRFTASETALLRSVASQTAAAIVHRQLYLDALEAQRYERQLNYAGAIQRRMIPQSPPEHAGIEFATVYEPTSDVGGDFFDFLDFSDADQLGVCIADVVGKGIPAALMMAALRTAFRLYASASMEITEAVTMTNIHMCRETLVSEFATLFYGVFEEDGRQLTFCNAGHDPPLLARAGRLTPLQNENFIIGVNPTQSYERRTIALQPDDVILFYTDGLVDAANFNAEQFGRERVESSLLRYAGHSAQHIAGNLMWDVRRFIGLADQADDITMVVAKVR